MAQLAIYKRLDPAVVKDNLDQVTAQITEGCAAAGRDPATVEIVAATKYVAPAAMEALLAAGITTAGENRAQDLKEKQALYGDRFTWDFIGHLQSNKVKQVLPLVRMIHSIDSLSTVAEIDRQAVSPINVLLQVNISQEASKYGIIPIEVDRFLEEASGFAKVNFNGLMTMPPLKADPRAVRSIFAALRGLASDLSQKWHGRYQFKHLSMGTSHDFGVAVEEGATIVRIGSVLFE